MKPVPYWQFKVPCRYCKKIVIRSVKMKNAVCPFCKNKNHLKDSRLPPRSYHYHPHERFKTLDEWIEWSMNEHGIK